jgi:hypothetical protein
MMGVVWVDISTFPARVPTELGGDSSDIRSHMSSVGVDSFAGLGPFATPKAH